MLGVGRFDTLTFGCSPALAHLYCCLACHLVRLIRLGFLCVCCGHAENELRVVGCSLSPAVYILRLQLACTNLQTDPLCGAPIRHTMCWLRLSRYALIPTNQKEVKESRSGTSRSLRSSSSVLFEYEIRIGTT